MIDQREISVENAATAGDAAAMWWSMALTKPKFDNGTDDPTTRSLAELAATADRRSPADLEIFAVVLSRKLNEQLQSSSNDYIVREYGIELDVDYYPNRFLAECATEAGLTIALWPWKTNMFVKANEVSVSYGYGAERKIVWKKD